MKFNTYFPEFLFLKVKSVCSFCWLKQSKPIQHFDYSYMFNMLCETPSFTLLAFFLFDNSVVTCWFIFITNVAFGVSGTDCDNSKLYINGSSKAVKSNTC